MSEVYLVYGTTGHYSDRTEWYVAVLPTEEQALKLTEELRLLSKGLDSCYHLEKEFFPSEDSNWNKVPARLLELDPDFFSYSDGTDYFYEKVPFRNLEEIPI